MSPTELISAFTWRDGLDFGLLFLIAYWLLRVVQGTRAAPVLVAVASFGVLAWTVQALDLIAVASLLKYVFSSVILLVIVVFQQELRRALLYIGQRLLPAGRREAAESAVGELVAGLERLKRARVGALVILQGEIDVLAVATHRGVRIDAPLRSETLVALCVPHAVNTAHDGAILIQDFRIARAGIICPLTEQHLDPRFGTRHRAAIGSTEETDALALVVSEERGELRIVQHGQMSEALRISELEARITAWLTAPRAEATRAPTGAGESHADLSTADLSRADMSRMDLERSAVVRRREDTDTSLGGSSVRVGAKKA
ncbi:MAG: DNA integrity scanning protein DisA nucleotide-binding domain protein [Myxococcales bacterium]|nr:diadenylate cyclase [Myxococcales bacterium]MCB9713719.1 DNA integrity scanning protein DisA nucleotide-binding domain protein [Myxococcales bacterium]